MGKVIRTTETEMYFAPFLDTNNQKHTHDGNTMNTTYYCKKCKVEFNVRTPHTCWCGWVQGSKTSLGYQGERIKIARKVESDS